jgi:hypothetical protein
MSDNANVKDIVAKIMQTDVQANGPVPDDPREAYVRGIEAALVLLALAVDR